MAGLDPVETLAAEVRRIRRTKRSDDLVVESDRVIARQMLKAVWVQDWRLVRLANVDDLHVDDGADWWRITDEWEPV